MKPFIFTDITFLPDSKWVTVLLLIFLTTGFNTFEPNAAEDEFYLPADPEYSIVDSVMDSIRFTMTRTLTRCDQGHLASKSSFVNPEGEIMHWHDFGDLEGYQKVPIEELHKFAVSNLVYQFFSLILKPNNQKI